MDARSKFCNKCSETKSTEEFCRNKRRRDGHGPWCKACAREATASYRRRKTSEPVHCDCGNPVQAAGARCRRCTIRQQRQLLAGRAASLAADRVTAGEKRCHTCDRVLPLVEFKLDKRSLDGRWASCRLCSRYTDYRRRAKKREIVEGDLRFRWELTREQFYELHDGACTYCGTPKANGIDRVASEIGYTPENSTPCCYICNTMKLDHSVEEWLAHIRKVLTHSQKK